MIIGEINTNPICFFCSNYQKDLKCKAFPKDIPNEILSGENDHSKPLPNQKNDIVFEPINKVKKNK